MQALLADRTVDAVGTSAVELQTLLAQLSATVAAQRTELQALSGSLRRTASSVERATAGPELERSIARLDQLTARLDETSLSLDRAGNSLETVLARVERGEGTLGRLTTDALYENLNQAAVNLNRLTEDIQQNPRRYINLRVF
jgi:phospholipid/cholesterol/gamma-HCH transport system substrate-binding protein